MKVNTKQTLQNACKSYSKGEKSNLRHAKKDFTIEAQNELKRWKPSKSYDDSSLFQVIDFFSGCGGMSLGFDAVSRIFPAFKIIGGIDIDEQAAKTFSHNLNAPCVVKDVRDVVNNSQELNNLLRNMKDYDPKKPLIVIGCAPCQGFTSHRKKNWKKRDHRNTLVGAFAAIAAKLNPECIVMENVPEMLSKKYWNHFQEAKNIFESSGYIVKQSIYNAATFGVPQERFRAIVIAMKQDFALPLPIFSTDEYITVRDAIGKLPAVEPGREHPSDKLHRSSQHRQATIETIRAISKNGGSRPPGVGPKCLDKIKGFYDVYGRLHWDKPSITITHYARNPASGRYVHPEQDRGLTMREAALLQSFPFGFNFQGSFDSVFKQIGEAVPPKMSCGVAASILVELLSTPPSESEKESMPVIVEKPITNSFSSVIASLKSKR